MNNKIILNPGPSTDFQRTLSASHVLHEHDHFWCLNKDHETFETMKRSHWVPTNIHTVMDEHPWWQKRSQLVWTERIWELMCDCQEDIDKPRGCYRYLNGTFWSIIQDFIVEPVLFPCGFFSPVQDMLVHLHPPTVTVHTTVPPLQLPHPL